MDRTDDMKQACIPPAEQDDWIREAADKVTLVEDAVGEVMRRSGGRCNPRYVYDEIRRVRGLRGLREERYWEVEEDWI
jgi:hypothetical protein